MINVEGDAIGAGIVAHLSRRELQSATGDKADHAEMHTGFDEDDIPYTTNYPPHEELKTMDNGAVNPTFMFAEEHLHTEL